MTIVTLFYYNIDTVNKEMVDLPPAVLKATEQLSSWNSTFIQRNSTTTSNNDHLVSSGASANMTVKSTFSDTTTTTTTTCPQAIQRAVGLYQEGQRNNPTNNMLDSTVLITTVDSSFWELYVNWNHFTERAGLKHVVVALDGTVYERLGPQKSILYDTTTATTNNNRFNSSDPVRENRLRMLCSKLHLKLSILQDCPHINVVFSDVDVVLLRDPFQHDLGSLIVHDHYDFVYSVESSWLPQPRSHACLINQTFGVQAFPEGNTGLEYYRRNSNGGCWTTQVLQKTLKRCMLPANKYHDQALFWKFMRRLVYNKHQWYHCNVDNYGKAQPLRQRPHKGPSLCCLDPFDYPSGWIRPNRTDDGGVVTFHANAVMSGVEGKIEKLKTWVDGWLAGNNHASWKIRA